MSTENRRDGFTSRLGFTLAAVGSAVGMSNVWAFPYRTATYGGGAYLLPYIICVIVLGSTGIVEEISFGRWAKTGPLGAMQKAIDKPGIKHIGIIPVLSSFAMAAGYAVIMGWGIRYLVGAFTGQVTGDVDPGAYFGAITGEFGSIPWHVAALILAIIAGVAGVARGIEKINKVVMPLFYILFIGMAIYMLTIPGSSEGYKYLFIPRAEMLLNPKTWVYALGQAFFSLSLAGNGSVIYGSYLSRKEDAVLAARNVAIFDTLAAVLASLVIIPAVFAFHKDLGAGPALMFITLPAIFREMGAFGQIFAIIFFLAIFFAAISSLMNLFEAPIEMLQDKLHMKRPVAVALVVGLGFLVGVFLESGDVIGNWMDLISIYFCPVGALLAGICFYWVLDRKTAEAEMSLGRDKPLPKWMYPVGKYVYCGIAIAVIVLGIALGGIG